MDSFDRTLSEKKKLDAIERIKNIKHQVDLAKERIADFQKKIRENQSEIADIELRMTELKREIAEIYIDNFKDE